MDTTVSVAPFWAAIQPIVLEVAGALITALIAWAATVLHAKAGVDIDAKHREALHSALETGVKLALNKLGGKLESRTVDVKSEVVAESIKWAQHSVPDAIKHFNLDKNIGTLQNLALSKVQEIAGSLFGGLAGKAGLF